MKISTPEIQILDREILEAIRAISWQLDDLRSAFARLQQLRQQDEAADDARLVVEDGCCGSKVVVR